ncbi:MAG: hypothetical protein B7Z60_00110 [Ferrovum sp. 37-45-19]|uniref:type II secretion system F family protein n=1 Tax=Ferrovum sp. JA12 TaxID=1356299 RepID=UPI0007027D40|nr:type II secretion system F family protein [Ferrovum sp. JA12]OYV79767.1 MAG: hypothetical protein B7Z65_03400 [Ferrovum sp. 21-44-67]OYV95389.1 MAG: hypothetical protein B7Z60_00110 [Ferrovum sp. 37-45-19]OZB31447.1 MAG: hypothetical protein B7X47_09295 [Ferrovum sp. 34-44-207]HQT81179.1 type II secretion system F family protein [Ferrovaceae bacterium]KRH78066.1 bacterial type II secretion system protein F domain protein [Ferrovum sp. JA12]
MTLLTVVFFINLMLSLVMGIILIKSYLSHHSSLSPLLPTLPLHQYSPTEPVTRPQRGLLSFFTASQNQVNLEEWCRFFDLLCFSLKSGLTLRQAFQALLEHVTGPLHSGLQQVLHEINLGSSTSDSLNHWLNSLEDPLLKRFIFIVELHEQTGGDMVRLLKQWTPQLRQRQLLLTEVKHATKEARASGVILSLLTPMMACVTWYLHPQLWHEALNTQLGLSLLIGTVLLWLIGSLWTHKLTQGTRHY